MISKRAPSMPASVSRPGVQALRRRPARLGRAAFPPGRRGLLIGERGQEPNTPPARGLSHCRRAETDDHGAVLQRSLRRRGRGPRPPWRPRRRERLRSQSAAGSTAASTSGVEVIEQPARPDQVLASEREHNEPSHSRPATTQENSPTAPGLAATVRAISTGSWMRSTTMIAGERLDEHDDERGRRRSSQSGCPDQAIEESNTMLKSTRRTGPRRHRETAASRPRPGGRVVLARIIWAKKAPRAKETSSAEPKAIRSAIAREPESVKARASLCRRSAPGAMYQALADDRTVSRP